MPRTAGMALDLLARTEHHRYGPHRQQRADLHVPREGGPDPVVVLLHGGFWRATYEKVVMKPLAADLVRRGFATWNLETGGSGATREAATPTPSTTSRGIDHLAELDDPRLDRDVTALGRSAGGHLALWAASRSDARVPRLSRSRAAAATWRPRTRPGVTPSS
jgi:acetyl esterase/lipase